MSLDSSGQRAFSSGVFFYAFILSILLINQPASALQPRDALGPSARTTPIVFAEIMYKPAARTDGKNVEFIEIYNSNPWFHDISGYQVTCADMSYTFPAGTIIASNSFIVL